MTRKGPVPTDWSKVKSRVCTKCGRRRPIREYYVSRGIPFSWCKDCEKARVSKWGKDNKEKRVKYTKDSKAKLRAEILSNYGGVCTCCGEDIPEFLAVDHVFNDGAAHRKELGNKMLYHWLRKNGFPKDRFQLLCHNCNMAKSIYGECPHQKE